MAGFWYRKGMVAVVVGLGMGAAGFASGGPAEPAVALPPMVVTASRAPVALERLPLAVDRLEGAALEAPTALTVDDALRVSPAFSLFRRTGSLTAHPTAQGVSLRGIGPSGASRSLVLLDGLPLNDPFGGWVAWSKVPRLSLGTAEIVRGGGSAVWGSAAIGGTVQLLSRPMSPGTGRVLGEAGSAGLARVEMLGDVSAGQGRLRAGGRWFRTDGWHAIREDQRGGIDRRLDSRHWLAHAAWEGELREGMVLRVGGRVFDERRGNGTPYTGNTSEEAAAHFALAGQVAPDVTVQILGYGQRQRFASRFSSVAADRESERPALDQHDVPADAWGASAVASWRHPDGALTTLGGDWRAVSGETREDYFYSGSGFLRRRHAGGDQWTGGLFAAHQRDIGEAVTLSLNGRLDAWWLRDGHRDEWNLESGAPIRGDRYADRDGVAFSPGIGAVWRVARDWRLRGAAYRAFRLPTLNELYRPYRVGSVATEANPALRPETLTGFDVGGEYAAGDWRFTIGGFWSELEDAVANVTLATSPTFTRRQRQNLERVRVRGIEAGAAYRPHEALEVAVDYLLADARVQRAVTAPELEGRRLAQVPRHTATLRVRWRPAERWRVDVAGRAFSGQYEDDLNTLPLAGAVTLGAGASWQFADGWEAGLALDNVFDAEVETRRTADGLVFVAPGRAARLSVRAAW